jgi:hypothetical protein
LSKFSNHKLREGSCELEVFSPLIASSNFSINYEYFLLQSHLLMLSDHHNHGFKWNACVENLEKKKPSHFVQPQYVCLLFLCGNPLSFCFKWIWRYIGSDNGRVTSSRTHNLSQTSSAQNDKYAGVQSLSFEHHVQVNINKYILKKRLTYHLCDVTELWIKNQVTTCLKTFSQEHHHSLFILWARTIQQFLWRWHQTTLKAAYFIILLTYMSLATINHVLRSYKMGILENVKGSNMSTKKVCILNLLDNTNQNCLPSLLDTNKVEMS